MTTDQKTTTLIDQLSGELKPVRRLAHPVARLVAWSAVALIYIAVVLSLIGLRPDWGVKLRDTIFLFEMAMGAVSAFACALAALWLGFPEVEKKGWIKNVPLTLMAVIGLWMAARGIADGFAGALDAIGHCHIDGLLLVFVPALFAVFLSMRGRTSSPGWVILMNVISVSLLGWIGLRLSCSVDLAGHVFLYHFSPFVGVSLVLALIGRVFYRW